jgi:hypothetical protein
MTKAFTLSLFIGLILSPYSDAKIYKFTDAYGNMHYSDKKPNEGGDLSPSQAYTVIEDKHTASRELIEPKKPANGQLFNDFVIASPKENETLKNSHGNINAQVKIDGKLSSNYRIKFYLDQLPHGKVKSDTQLIADIEKGKHILYAEVIENYSRKVIQTTPTITFYLE